MVAFLFRYFLILKKKLFAIYCIEIQASCKDLTETGSYGKDGKFEFI